MPAVYCHPAAHYPRPASPLSSAHPVHTYPFWPPPAFVASPAADPVFIDLGRDRSIANSQQSSLADITTLIPGPVLFHAYARHMLQIFCNKILKKCY
ncbi:hypothetical protein Hypma_002409 [Hypsizygus marmoreus]|uniref:Uncharacterized protein n=1 Tax=Hypsizygus marmoreus TaxID=39966 RepID=A0A369J4E7_HYPMA|nr:hypothetical protein Hypma_002409 [Hypsizygus marmoreus]